MLVVRCFFLLLVLGFTASLPAQETLRQYLSGRGKDDAVPWKFMCTAGAHSGYWTNLAVPSQWDVQGFGTLNYRKDGTNPPPESGLYEREFTVPENLSHYRIFLVFEGAMTDTTAKINGESAGPTHQGGFYRFKYEVTKLVKFGATNKLEVTVDKHSANRSVNNAERNADYWLFGGIYRPVYLEAEPPQFIERLAIDARADGALTVEAFINGATNAGTIEAQVYTLDGKPVGEPFVQKFAQPTAEGGNVSAVLKAQIASPNQWTAETPNLYAIEVRLKHGDELLHRYRNRFGFRTMEVRDGDGLYVNGKRVILKGVNRHSFWPETGRTLSATVQKLDIDTMKDMNMNAVRMSHYPPDQDFLDLCDVMGLYVLDELASWHKGYDTDVGRKLVEEMVARDVNHPCILFWDNGDEGGWNTNLDAEFPKFDPQQRRVLHPWASFSGLCTAHYLAFDKAQIAATGQSVFYRSNQELVATNDPTKYIYMPTEFMHGLFDGGAGAGLEDYWKMMSESKYLGGGFIWTFLDEGLVRPDTGQIDVAGNQAPDGIVGPHREREGSFNTIKEIWSPIQVTRESSGTFTVENRYNFIDAKDCTFTWQRLRFDTPNQDSPTFNEVDEDTVEGIPSIPPGSKGTFRLRLPRATEHVDALSLKVEDPTGRELWTWVWPMARAGDLTKLINAPAPQKASATETNDAIEVKSGDLTVKFNKQTGWLSEVTRETDTYSFNNGPRPAIGNATLTSIRFDQDGPDVIVSAKYSGDLKSVLWRIFGNGWVQCDYKYTATGTNDFFGVAFDYPEDQVQSKRWLGDGPSRVWKNRMRGVTFNVWDGEFNDTITGYRDWDYPEFKGCFSNVRWLQLETTEGTITVVPKKIPFVQVLTPEQPPDNLAGKTKVKLPKAGLAFLDAIPAIGSKFKDATAGGPQGQPNVANGEYSGSVSFYFGDFPEPEEK
jgi:hypothetical protein